MFQNVRPSNWGIVKVPTLEGQLEQPNHHNVCSRDWTIWSSDPVNGKRFFSLPRTALGPTELPLRWVPGFFPGEMGLLLNTQRNIPMFYKEMCGPLSPIGPQDVLPKRMQIFTRLDGVRHLRWPNRREYFIVSAMPTSLFPVVKTNTSRITSLIL